MGLLSKYRLPSENEGCSKPRYSFIMRLSFVYASSRSSAKSKWINKLAFQGGKKRIPKRITIVHPLKLQNQRGHLEPTPCRMFSNKYISKNLVPMWQDFPCFSWETKLQPNIPVNKSLSQNSACSLNSYILPKCSPSQTLFLRNYTKK